MKFCLALMFFLTLATASCSANPACSSQMTSHEHHSGRAQHLMIAVEEALLVTERFTPVEPPLMGSVNFVLEETRASRPGAENGLLTYAVTDISKNVLVRKTVQCSKHGENCVPGIVADMVQACRLRT